MGRLVSKVVNEQAPMGAARQYMLSTDMKRVFHRFCQWGKAPKTPPDLAARSSRG